MAGKADGSVLINTLMDTSGIQDGIGRIKGSIGSLGSSIAKLGVLVAGAFGVKSLVNFARECIDLGSDLDEVQNVVDVTFGKMSEHINQFAKSAATSLGLSELAAKQFTSTFGAMYKSMGFTEQAAAGMSIEMTKLAADMASFYNLDAETAFMKIRAGISGETEPLKQLGINLSEVNLEEFRLQQGLTTAYSKMNQQEKALLRYNYLLSVTSDAQGDFARTSNSWANQTRILKLQFDSIKADLGQGFIAVFTPILQVINKLLTAIARLASSFRAFTQLITGKKSEAKGGGMAIAIDDTADSTNTLADATKKASKATKQAAKENRKYLSGLDEIRTYTEAIAASTGGDDAGSTGSKAASSSGGAANIPDFNFGELETGETVVDELALKMKSLYETITKGAQPTIQALKNLWNNGLKKLGQFTAGALYDFYKGFLVPVGDWLLGKGIPELVDALNNGLMSINYEGLSVALAGLWDALAPFAITIGEGLLWFYENVMIPIGVWTYNEAVPRFLETLSNVISIVNTVMEAAQPYFQWFFDFVLAPIAEFTGGIFITIWDGINAVLKTFGEWCKKHEKVVGAITTVIGFFLSTLTGFPIVLLTAIASVLNMVKNWDQVKEKLAEIWQSMKAKAQEVWDAIVEYLKGIWQSIVDAVSPVLSPIIETLSGIWQSIVDAVTTVLSPIIEKLAQIWDTIYTAVMEKWEQIKGVISTAWNNIKTSASSVWNVIKNVLVAKWNAVKTAAGTAFEKIKKVISEAWIIMKAIASTTWETIKKTVVSKWGAIKTKATEKFTEIKTAISDKWTDIKTDAVTWWNDIKDEIIKKWNVLKDNCFGENGIFTKIGTEISGIWDSIKTTAETKWGEIKTSISGIWGKLKEGAVGEDGLFTQFGEDLSSIWDGIKKTAGEKWQAVTDTVSGAWNAMLTAAQNEESPLAALGTYIGGIWKGIQDNLVQAWEGENGIVAKVTGFFQSIMDAVVGEGGFYDTVKGGLVGAFSDAVDAMKIPINGIIGAVNYLIETCVTAINAVIDTLNTLSFSIPSWVPGLGGKHFGLSIPRITSYPQIPQLAQGAVIPPKAPFLAMLGDQRNGTNLEAPENLIRQIIRDEMGGQDIHVTLNLDGKTVWESVLRQARRQQMASGVNPFEMA